MTLGEIVSLIQMKLGNRTQLESQVKQELQFRQKVLEREVTLPWFLRSMVAVNVTAGYGPKVGLSAPAGYLRMASAEECLWCWEEGTTYSPIQKDDFGYLMQQEALQGTGKPEAYALVGHKLFFFPLLDTTYSVLFDAFWEDNVISADAGTNNWMTYAPDLLVACVGKAMAGALRAPELVLQFANEEREARRRLAMENVAREQAGDPMSLRD